jgi:hypothetical protein
LNNVWQRLAKTKNRNGGAKWREGEAPMLDTKGILLPSRNHSALMDKFV